MIQINGRHRGDLLVSKGLSQEAAVEASRCLFCFDAPCIMACPTGIDIPSFIKKIETDNIVGAARTILSANILGAGAERHANADFLGALFHGIRGQSVDADGCEEQTNARKDSQQSHVEITA